MTSLKNLLQRSMIELLKPLVRFVVRRSMRIQDFEESAKIAFLEIAKEELKKTGGEITISKISAMTGLQRRDIKRLSSSEQEPRKGADLITRVIGLWLSSRRFSSKNGKAKMLSFKGRMGEFVTLVESISKDLNPYTVLFELERCGIAKQTDEGIKLIKRGYEPQGDIAEGLRLLGEDSDYLHRAVEHNLFIAPEDPQLHIKTEYDNIPASRLAEVKKWFLEKGAHFHNEARKYLANLDRDTTANLHESRKEEGSIRAVVGTFGLVESSDTHKFP